MVQYILVTTGICMNSVLKCCAIAAFVRTVRTAGPSVPDTVYTNYSLKAGGCPASKKMSGGALSVDTAELSRENSSDEGKNCVEKCTPSRIVRINLPGFPGCTFFLRNLHTYFRAFSRKPTSAVYYGLLPQSRTAMSHVADTEDASEPETVRMDEEEARSR